MDTWGTAGFGTFAFSNKVLKQQSANNSLAQISTYLIIYDIKVYLIMETWILRCSTAVRTWSSASADWPETWGVTSSTGGANTNSHDKKMKSNLETKRNIKKRKSDNYKLKSQNKETSQNLEINRFVKIKKKKIKR